MRIAKQIFIFTLSVAVIFSSVSDSVMTARAEGYYDTWYGKISWKTETSRLDSFLVILHQNPGTIGYIAFQVGERDSYEKVKSRINRAVKYMVEYRKFDKNRLVVVYAGKRETTTTILDIKSRDLPTPIFGIPENKIISSEFKSLND